MKAKMTLSTWSLRTIIGIVLLFSLGSCKTLNSLDKPFAVSVPREVKPGDQVRLTLTNGVVIQSIAVKEVWPDSIRVGEDTRAIRMTDIVKIQKRKVDPVATTMAGLFGLLGVVLVFAVILANGPGIPGWGI